MDKTIIIVFIIFIVIVITGISLKIYTKRKLNDIDGWNGVHKKKDFGNRKINNSIKKK